MINTSTACRFYICFTTTYMESAFLDLKGWVNIIWYKLILFYGTVRHICTINTITVSEQTNLTDEVRDSQFSGKIARNQEGIKNMKYLLGLFNEFCTIWLKYLIWFNLFNSFLSYPHIIGHFLSTIFFIQLSLTLCFTYFLIFFFR